MERGPLLSCISKIRLRCARHCLANMLGMELLSEDSFVFVIFTFALGTCQPAVLLELRDKVTGA